MLTKFQLHLSILIKRDWHKTKSFNNSEYFTAENSYTSRTQKEHKRYVLFSPVIHCPSIRCIVWRKYTRKCTY